MRITRSILSVFIVFFFVSSLSIPVFAEENGKEITTEKANQEREGITFNFEDSDKARWAEEYIGKMQSKGVIKGYDDGSFRPNAPVTRIEAIVMAVRLMGLEEEALSKPSDKALHFKDEKEIPSWARGHVVVALENGLFNATEDKIQAEKPASRVWIVQLLVKALGLEEEALKQITNIPDFKDVNAIPAGSIGYVNIAVEQEITSGYPDNTFKPNKNVTRGEMAAFLDRTNEDLLEQSGALTVQGIITDISFEQGKSAAEVDGTITIKTSYRDSATYDIPSNLLVQYYKRFITADQLVVGDIVGLVTKDKVVVEANLFNEDDVNTEVNLVELEIEVDGWDREYEVEYKNKKGKIEAEIKNKVDGHETKVKGQDAVKQVEELIQQLALTSDMTKDEIVASVLKTLQIEEGKYEELEIEIKFTNGKKVEIERKGSRIVKENSGIREFEFSLKMHGDQELKLKYENEKGKVKAEVEKDSKKGKEKYKDKEAIETIQSLLDEIALTEEMTKDEILEAILTALEINKKDIEDLEIEIKFTNGKEIEIEIENENDDDD